MIKNTHRQFYIDGFLFCKFVCMMSSTFLSNLPYPIILAPMLGVVTPKMVADVANIGGLGSLPLGGLSPEASRKLIQETRGLLKMNLQ